MVLGLFKKKKKTKEEEDEEKVKDRVRALGYLE